MSEAPPVIVRNAVRHDVVIRGSVRIAPCDIAAVRVGPASGAQNGWIDVDIVDLSENGLGLISPVFFPRRTVLEIRVLDHGEAPAVIAHLVIKVQRAIMTDRRPAYLAGCTFENNSNESLHAVRDLLERFRIDAA